MTEIQSSLEKLTFVKPSPAIHAPITLGWFESDDGHETLLLMGNAEHEIEPPSLQTELQILEDFVLLEKKNEQLTWMLDFDGDIVGVGWIELTENHGVKPPSVHLMIGNKKYRGQGIGRATMQALILYIRNNIDTKFVYSRHLKSNSVVANMNRGLGFKNEGGSYLGDNGLEWQNIKLVV